ncbi:hypothetical protein ACTJKK_09005 [Microbacterium sp. 22179]|uniref:hypothetical protein n=1 Tax=Microbacterium sp. 22179 TaxID=3453886 RepID=UPI003F8242AD
MNSAMKTRWLAVAALLLSLHALTACGSPGRNEMTSEEAREQLSTAVDVVKTATGQGWVVDIEPTLLGCSRAHSQWTTSWSGSPTTDRDSSYASVREALEEAGFATYINGEHTTTPVLSAQAADGFGLDYSQPIEGGPVGFNVSSGCFPEGE